MLCLKPSVATSRAAPQPQPVSPAPLRAAPATSGPRHLLPPTVPVFCPSLMKSESYPEQQHTDHDKHHSNGEIESPFLPFSKMDSELSLGMSCGATIPPAFGQVSSLVSLCIYVLLLIGKIIVFIQSSLDEDSKVGDALVLTRLVAPHLHCDKRIYYYCLIDA